MDWGSWEAWLSRVWLILVLTRTPSCGERALVEIACTYAALSCALLVIVGDDMLRRTFGGKRARESPIVFFFLWTLFVGVACTAHFHQRPSFLLVLTGECVLFWRLLRYFFCGVLCCCRARRIVAAVSLDASMILELLSPLAPAYFLLIASVANVGTCGRAGF